MKFSAERERGERKNRDGESGAKKMSFGLSMKLSKIEWSAIVCLIISLEKRTLIMDPMQIVSTRTPYGNTQKYTVRVETRIQTSTTFRRQKREKKILKNLENKPNTQKARAQNS